MSEDTLKSLMELFALIVRQDSGILLKEREYVSNLLTKQLTNNLVAEYLALFDFHAGSVEAKGERTKPSSTSVRDSVKILGICKKINRTLDQQQKVVVLMMLYELASEDQFTSQKMNILNTVAKVFKISQEEVTAIEHFVRNDSPEDIVNPAIRFLFPGNEKCDISATFLAEISVHPLSLSVENLTYRFIDGDTAVNNVSFSVREGNLIGIMGASGAGKTTLLNIMSGILTPTSGTIRINGIEIFKDSKAIEGVLGYVPQDDLLIEDLTIFENLWFAARQCFGNKSNEEIIKITDQTLMNLGLFEKRNLKVGSPMNKVISGGERKRLNIALELVREPSVLFFDEPTSGLSSHDSKNLMDLLRDLTLKGKLIVTVIHQPSSELFKMFDKVIILDQGGYMAYFGNPIESVIYFKTLNVQINSSIGECPSCGNVNPETIFNIIEMQIDDESGGYTEKRKVKPAEWASIYSDRYPYAPVPEIMEPPHKNLERPSPFKQFLIYISRDCRSKIANMQYILLIILVAPVLGFILSFIIRYIPDPNSDTYIFFENENIPIYIFMSLIVALFLGLTLSAEEIFRDRKILKRERFLSLSRSSYILSKVVILIGISSIQVFLFLIIANPVLELKGLFLKYFLALLTTAFCANMIGLNISASFNSAITIYIVIPLIIIPMMVLSGAMFSFDKLNRRIGSIDKVPVIAELMPTRWTYEALMVTQFKDNKYNRFSDTMLGRTIYQYKKEQSIANYYENYLANGLKSALEKADSIFRQKENSGDSPVNTPGLKKMTSYGKFELLRIELAKLTDKFPTLLPFRNIDDLTPERYNETVYMNLRNYFNFLEKSFREFDIRLSKEWDKFYSENKSEIQRLQNAGSNERLEEIVTKYYERNKILEYQNTFVQNYDPIYIDPQKRWILGFRTHFFAPSKYIFGYNADTFTFNILLVLLCTAILIVILYYNLPGRLVGFIENFRFRK